MEALDWHLATPSGSKSPPMPISTDPAAFIHKTVNSLSICSDPQPRTTLKLDTYMDNSITQMMKECTPINQLPITFNI